MNSPCPLCDDTGWKPVEDHGVRRVVRCDCWRDRIVHERLGDANIPKRYLHCTLTNFTAYNESLEQAVVKARAVVDAFPVSTRGLLLEGQPGVGKTHLARVLHATTGRGAHPCLVYACGDSANPSVDLFGAAASADAGLTTAVQVGTLILDDVEKLDARLQERLTNWIASRAEASGGMPLVVGLTTGMRRDAPLLDWLGRVALGIPPLRERSADIEPLARHFLAQSAATLGRPFEGFTRGAVHRLVGHVWPGNVRELALAVAQAAQTMPGGALQADHFLAADRGAPGPAWAPAGEPRPLREIEDAYIDHVIGICGGNKTRAAKILGVARETLRIRLTARQTPA